MTCPDCERYKQSASMWRNKAYELNGTPLPWKPRLDQGPDYERGFIDGMQKQMQSSVDKAVNHMAQPAPVLTGIDCSCGRKWRVVNNTLTATEPSKMDGVLRKAIVRSGKVITPPQHTWVGLTDEELDQGLLRSHYALKTADAWRAGAVFAMAKLKEKNT